MSGDAESLSTVDLDVEDGVARLTLNRPEAANTINVQLAEDLLAAADQLHQRDDVRAVLLAGRGDRFCAGGDLASFSDAAGGLGEHLEQVVASLHPAILRLLALDAPVLAAVQGSAAGAGFSLACAADLVVAAESAKFVLAYSAVGLTPDGSGSWFLPRLVGLGRALDIALTNRVLTAAEAEEWGIVSRVVPDDQLSSEADALARRLADGPSLTLGATRRLLHDSFARSLPDQLDEEQRALRESGNRADGREGIAAFLEKRPPSFEGR